MVFSVWLSRYRRWRLKRQAVDILHTFDDRTLADIGTFRDSIELFVDKVADQ
ncbi:DUF1127 domain-containing protein [Devosia aquimaris]|uniref:DUF1127 domain-containing protein n=1 Tax=Devosia aquimaris TaxID=2866214 RepID=UPI0037BE5A9F